MLRPLLISVQRDDGAGALAPERSQNGGQSPTCACVFCGASLGLHADDGRSCAICTLVRHLERPRIDEEARLVWLPEMSQAALVCLLREMHCRMREAGESCGGEGGPAVVSEERAALHYARTALEGRAAVAAEHLGTDRPSDLAYVARPHAAADIRAPPSPARRTPRAAGRTILRRRGGRVSRDRRLLAERPGSRRCRRSRNADAA